MPSSRNKKRQSDTTFVSRLRSFVQTPVCFIIVFAVFASLLLLAFAGWFVLHPSRRSSQLYADVKEVLSWGTRVAGSDSPAHRKFRSFIVDRIHRLNSQLIKFQSSSPSSPLHRWRTEIDSFSSNTVMGNKAFHNIWATFGPETHSLNRELPIVVVSAHYDSKLFTEFEFLGATDSAVSCCMMLDLAANWTKWFGTEDPAVVKTPLPFELRLVWFDGEEAFKDWTDTDSIYGSRHLAAKWESEGILSRIKLFVLLDLLGAQGSQFVSFFETTHAHYLKLSEIETSLRRRGMLRSAPAAASPPMFRKQRVTDGVQDDHVPFMQRGVPILHLIPVPFPRVWHTKEDDFSALSWPFIYDLTLILQSFLQQIIEKRSL